MNIRYTLRGGSWYDFLRDVLMTSRFITTPEQQFDGVGFRLIQENTEKLPLL